MKVVMLAKEDKPTVKEAIEYLDTHFKNFVVYTGQRQDTFPKELESNSQDILISYLSPWIIPFKVLNKTTLWNINFHPGPPEYPGIGCFNFAMYNNEKTYGVTVHLMAEKVDSGKIIDVDRFALMQSESILTLSLKSYKRMLSLFFKTVDFIIRNDKLPECHENWKRQPYTRKELESLCWINMSMNEEEVKRRIKATTYPNMPGPYIELFGHKFEYSLKR